MLGVTLDRGDYVNRLSRELEAVDQDALGRWADLVHRAWETDRFVYIIGNGGSGCNASHMAEDFGKNSVPESALHDETRKRLKVLSLTDNAGWIMAVGNDLDYDQVFLQQLMNYGEPGDLLIAISGSGNSANILNAVDWANRHGLVTYGLTGYEGGKLKELQQEGLHVALADMGMVESIHLCLFHWVLNDVYARINREGRYQKNG